LLDYALILIPYSNFLSTFQYEEIYAPEIEDFVYITDNAYTAGELRAMEGRILKCLDFSLGRPIAINFLRRFSKAGDVDVVHHTLAKYILEVKVMGLCFFTYVNEKPGYI
jgi:cyclin B